MMFKTLKQRLKYPHARSALKYILQNPSLFFAILQNPSKYYLSKTLEKVSSSNIVSCLHNFLPERFLNHLKETGFSDRQGVQLILYLIVRKYGSSPI